MHRPTERESGLRIGWKIPGKEYFEPALEFCMKVQRMPALTVLR